MIEQSILDFLTSKLSVPVYMEVPEDMDEEFVVIEKTGGGQTDKINSATFAIQSWATSLLDAAALNKDVLEAMEDAVTLDIVGACSLNSDYNFTDTDTKRYRYQAVYNIIHY